jgi:hypothetical protein
MTELFSLHLLECLQNHGIQSEVKVVTHIDLGHRIVECVFQCLQDCGVIFPLIQNRINNFAFNILALLLWGWIYFTESISRHPVCG